jgi:putative CocE/NonD family hydrolase
MDFRNLNRAPMVSIAGWYDIFLKAQLADFISAEKRGNNNNRMIIGPWCHGGQGEKNEYGGTKKSGNPAKMFLYAKNTLKGKKARLPKPLKDSRYNLFVMERNEYVGSDVWPPAGTEITPFYIGPDGYLDKAPAGSSGKLQYVYDPADPYPSIGGTILGDSVGPARQNQNVMRKDQLVFEMNISDKPLTLLGPVSATLWVSSDAPCTDFIAGIQDVFPDGKIINIQEGGARLNSIVTGKPFKTEISIWATGYQVNPGHKLRVFIASSWHPRYNRNLNNCQPMASATNPVKAVQSVYYGDTMSSSINLPIFEDRISGKGK